MSERQARPPQSGRAGADDAVSMARARKRYHPLRRMLASRQVLQNALLAREVLGPPKGLEQFGEGAPPTTGDRTPSVNGRHHGADRAPTDATPTERPTGGQQPAPDDAGRPAGVTTHPAGEPLPEAPQAAPPGRSLMQAVISILGAGAEAVGQRMGMGKGIGRTSPEGHTRR